jgi:DNA repair protein RadD
MKLRDYQRRSIDELYGWLSSNKGHPCVVLPTGSGKSVVIAQLIKEALQGWPETKVLMLCHQKELLEQNASKMISFWPNAPLGLYSASVGQKVLGEPITFAGIQSIRNKANDVGHIDICIVDECHCISHKDQGSYRKFLNDLLVINPAMRIVGYSATPYRLGHGLITDKPAMFNALLDPVSIAELVFKGYLATLRSKTTKSRLDVSSVHKRGGEFIESELQAAVDNKLTNEAVVREVIERAGDRKAWLFFCTGVDHAQNMAEMLRSCGIAADCVTGATPKRQREDILAAFKAGELTALTNANVLTTGFDYPDIDLIAMVRPTMSPSLYVQMAGRGMRPKSHTDHCLVLDFAGVVETHGPITAVRPPKKKGDGTGEAPVKVCENCGELCHPTVKECPSCGNPFPAPEPKKWKLADVDIMGLEGVTMNVSAWRWRKHISASSGNEMLMVRYYGDLSDPTVNEYFTVAHEGYAGDKARKTLLSIAKTAGLNEEVLMKTSLADIASELNNGRAPLSIEYRMDGKFYRIIKRRWHEAQHEAA